MIQIESDRLVVEEEGGRREVPMSSPEAFEILSRVWLRAGWEAKHVYSFTWLGRPVIQLPEDLLRLQEVIASVQPDLLIETGVAHGGSLVFYASLFKAMGRGRTVGIDVEIRPHNRRAIEEHVLSPYITLIEGSSVAPATIESVRALVRGGDTVMVVLDSDHRREHVLAELEAYAPLVTEGSYCVVADGIMESLAGASRTREDWVWNNPRQAALEFVGRHPEFAIEPPPFLFNEGSVRKPVTYFPDGYLRRLPAPRR